jgi:hypothetical protein
MESIRPLPRPPLDGAYYRRREREARALAAGMTDASVRKQMLDIAEEYARLAEQAEAWKQDHPEDQ